MSQIAVRRLEVGGVNSLEDSSGSRAFMRIALRETAGAEGCGPFENKVDKKSRARYDMRSRYIYLDIANVAQIGTMKRAVFRSSPNLVEDHLDPGLWITRRRPIGHVSHAKSH